MADASAIAPDGPRGPKPRRRLSPTNIMLYSTLFVVSVYYLLPLYVMIVTSLKGMPEIRLGNVFSPPVDITFEPWVKAWAEACTWAFAWAREGEAGLWGLGPGVEGR